MPFLVEGLHPILNEIFGPVELFFLQCNCSQVTHFKFFRINFLLQVKQMLSDSAIWNLELFVLFFLSDFLEGISIQFEHGSDLNQSALVFFIELFEER